MRLDELTKGSTRWYQPTQIQKKWLLQVEPKWCIDKPQANQTHKTHHGLNLKKNHHFFSYNIFFTSDKATPKWQKFPKLPRSPKILFFEWIMNLATLWAPNFIYEL
jgi:hypothetical protein